MKLLTDSGALEIEESGELKAPGAVRMSDEVVSN